jgi:hypothetical protein
MTNYISLFAPIAKPITPNHPIRTGKIKINEKLEPGDYEFGLYEEISKAGKKYLRGTIKEAFKKQVKPFSEPKEPESKFNENLGEDVPW